MDVGMQMKEAFLETNLASMLAVDITSSSVGMELWLFKLLGLLYSVMGLKSC